MIQKYRPRRVNSKVRSFHLNRTAKTNWEWIAILALLTTCLILGTLPQKGDIMAIPQINAANAQILPKKAIVEPVKAPEPIEKMIIRVAVEKGYHSPKFALSVARCESGLRPSAIGDHGGSFGLWQISLRHHPGITKSQALDPEWSTNWSMEQFTAGREYLWTCARMLS